MKKVVNILIGISMVLMLAGWAAAADINTLDRVSVLMTRSQVISMLGSPDNVIEVGNGLKADIYKVKNMEPMVGAGCLYEDDRHLAGQSFVFQGEMSREASERLKKHGFTVVDVKKGDMLLAGKDDDTGKPLVVHIVTDNGMTVVTTFEKSFYDRRVK